MGRMVELSPYDRSALREIHAFKNPEQAALSRWWGRVTEPVGKAADYVFDTSVAKAVQGIVSLLNDGASWTVRTEAIYAEFRSDGRSGVQGSIDIQKLSLEQVDRTVGHLATKYKAIAAAEGAGAGASGGPAILVDVPALVGIALRVVNEYAAYYGFETSTQGERMFAMAVLSAASSPTVAAKQVALAELTRASIMIGQRKTWEELQKVLSINAIKKVAEALGIRLTKAKLAQVVPVTGAIVGAGFNAWYLDAVTEAAYMLSRERFLIEKYGSDVVSMEG